VSAVLLNIVFNGVKKERDATCAIRRAGHDFDGTAKAER
jgi:NCS2 family nucleobase:cation symporter-2